MYDDPPNYRFLNEFDFCEEMYSFDIIRMAEDTETGKVYMAEDSGCSCPIPFEDHHWTSDWTEVRSYQEVLDFATSFCDFTDIPEQFRRQAQTIFGGR